MKRSRSDDETRGGLTRRELGRQGLAFLLALGWLPAARTARAADGDVWVTDVAGNQALLSGVQYVPLSAKPDQRCGNCVLFQARGEGRGKCALFQQGLVPEAAWCISWSPRPS